MVVDDNASFRELASQVFRSWGYDTAEAGSVAEALALGAEATPDVALVDIGLPDGDGFELARQLSSLAVPVRVVLTSTDADAGNVTAAEHAGAVGFVPKDELLGDRMQRLLAGP